MIEVGCCAHAFKGWSLAKAAGFLADCGFTWISPGATGPDAQIDPTVAAREPEHAAEGLLEVASAYGVRYSELFLCPVHVSGRAVAPSDPDSEAVRDMLDAFRAICRFARLAGFQNVMGVPGSPVEGEEPAETWRRSAEVLARMLDIALEEEMTFTVEPHRWSILKSPEDIRRMLDEVPGLKLTLDYSHYVGTGFGAQDLIPLHESAFHVHAKPCGYGYYKSLVHEDEGIWRPAIRDLMRRKWQGVISTECIHDTRCRTLTQNAAFQNILLAHELEMILKGVISQVSHE